MSPLDGRHRPRRGRSAYEDRDSAVDRTVIVATNGPRAGRIVGYELADGTFVEAKPCCENPLHCDRAECWTVLVDGRRSPAERF
jgi:hypothetical protein